MLVTILEVNGPVLYVLYISQTEQCRQVITEL